MSAAALGATNERKSHLVSTEYGSEMTAPSANVIFASVMRFSARVSRYHRMRMQSSSSARASPSLMSARQRSRMRGRARWAA